MTFGHIGVWFGSKNTFSTIWFVTFKLNFLSFPTITKWLECNRLRKEKQNRANFLYCSVVVVNIMTLEFRKIKHIFLFSILWFETH